MKKKRAFGQLEFAILNQFKDRQRQTVKQICESLGPEDKYTSIMTVMGRMVKKGLLLRELRGKQYEYSLPSSFPFFGGKLGPLATYLTCAKESLSDEELEQIGQLVERLRKEKKESS